AHGADRHQAAVAVHGERFDADAELLDALQEPVEIALHARPDRGIDDRRRQPLEFTEFRQHFAGHADVRVRQLLLHDRLYRLLMRAALATLRSMTRLVATVVP